MNERDEGLQNPFLETGDNGHGIYFGNVRYERETYLCYEDWYDGGRGVGDTVDSLIEPSKLSNTLYSEVKILE